MASSGSETVESSTARKLCGALNLSPHPAGFGWFKEVFRSSQRVNRVADEANRSFLTTIYFLQESQAVARWRILKSDELFVWLKGSPVKVYLLDPSTGNVKTVVIGDVIDSKPDLVIDHFQHTVPAGVYFNTEILEPDSYALFVCAVAPGFEFEDFQCVDESDLLKAFPQQKELIGRFERHRHAQ